MAAKRTIHPPKPSFDRPWSELTKHQQNALYVQALAAYNAGTGPNPSTRGAFVRAKETAKT
jgi:hypothetical protein